VHVTNTTRSAVKQDRGSLGDQRFRRRAAQVRILSWRPWRNDAGTVLGFISAELPSGMIVNGLKLMVGPKGKPWVACPATKREVPDGGKPVWDPTIEFASREVRDRFGAVILTALRAYDPHAFDDNDRSGGAGRDRSAEPGGQP
jgi:hypothetical protein